MDFIPRTKIRRKELEPLASKQEAPLPTVDLDNCQREGNERNEKSAEEIAKALETAALLIYQASHRNGEMEDDGLEDDPSGAKMGSLNDVPTAASVGPHYPDRHTVSGRRANFTHWA